ncbi:MAG TPA: hypothetical protein VEI97_16370, partial [bacterium]|nr:hypothetical protein [bacterium]
TFSITAGTAVATDPEGDPITFFAIANQAPTGPFPHAAGQPAPPINGIGPYNTLGTVGITVYARDPLHGNPTPAQPDSATAWPVRNAIVGTSLPGWVYTGVAQTTHTLEWVEGIAVDPSGNVFLALRGGNNTNVGSGLVTSGTSAEFVVKLDAQGNFLGEVHFDTNPNTTFESGAGLALDAAGNVFLYGLWRGTINLGGGNRSSNASLSSFNYDVFVVKLNNNLNYVWDWTSTGPGDAQYSGVSAPLGNPIAVDLTDGDVAITGGFSVTENFGLAPLNNSAASGLDPFVLKLNSAGSPQWGRHYPQSGTTSEQGYGLAFDEAGNLYNGGQYSNGADLGLGPRSSALGLSAYLVKLDGTTGSTTWDRTFGSATQTGTENVTSVAVDGTRVYAGGGYFNGTDFGGGIRTASGTLSDPFIAAFNRTTGAYLWDFTVTGSTATEEMRAVAVEGGDLFAGGVFSNTVMIGPNSRTAVGGADMFLVKLGTDGSFVYDRTWGSSATEAMRALDVVNGDVFAGGTFSGTVDFDPGTPVVNRTATGGGDFFALRLNGTTGEF